MLAAEIGGGVSMTYDPKGVTCVIGGGPSARVDWRELGSGQQEGQELPESATQPISTPRMVSNPAP
jgi:hypothetical protein